MNPENIKHRGPGRPMYPRAPIVAGLLADETHTMPTAPLKPCRHPGCHAVTADGYCPVHRKAQWAGIESRTTRPEVAAARRIRDSAAWRRARAWFAAQNPFCCDPFGVHGADNPTLGTQVHHVESLSARPDLAFDADNLRRLCDYCHSRIEFAERNKRDTRPMFCKSTTTGGVCKSLGQAANHLDGCRSP